MAADVAILQRIFSWHSSFADWEHFTYLREFWMVNCLDFIIKCNKIYRTKCKQTCFSAIFFWTTIYFGCYINREGMIYLYFDAFILPSVFTSLSGPAAEKHPHSTMLPPPCFKVVKMCLWSCVVFGLVSSLIAQVSVTGLFPQCTVIRFISQFCTFSA